MKNRSPVAVFFLPLLTFGIYGLVWSVKTKNEMNRQGADIPTAWLLIIPFINLYWSWKYCEGVEKVTNGKTSAVLAFVLLLLLGTIGMAIVQNEFNKVGEAPAAGDAPVQAAQVPSVDAPAPDNSFGGPVVTAQPVPVATTAPVVPVGPEAGPAAVVSPTAPSDQNQPTPQV